MDILILKTNINQVQDFALVKEKLNQSLNLRECTIDLGDIDKVVRIVGNSLIPEQVNSQIIRMGFRSEELTY